MTTSVQVCADTPSDVASINKWLLQRLVELMRPFGIQGITTTWAPVGMSGVMTISFTEVERTPPGNLAVLQPRVARWLAEGMQMFGLLEVDTTPEDEELKDLYRMWDNVAVLPPAFPAPAEDALPDPANMAAHASVKTPPVEDPTNEHVAT